MLRLRISRSLVSIENDAGQLESWRAVVALTVDGGRVGICSAAETEDEMVARMTRELQTVGRNLVARALVAEAEKRAAGSTPGAPKLAIVRPGQDPWWDRRIHDPYSLRKGEHRRSHDPREVLVVHPLEADTWSPYLLRGLLVYVFWSCTWTKKRAFFPLLHPPIELRIDESITGVDRAEVVDTVRYLWGRRRVHLPEGETIDPPPTTRQAVAYKVTRVLFWVAALVMLVTAYPEPGPLAIAAGVVAAACLFASRVLGARLEVARPRRSDSTGAASDTTSRREPDRDR